MLNNTMEVIKNFGTINQNLVFRQGNVLRTVADAKNVLAKATLDEDFPQDFGIYDVNEFMSAFNLIEDGNVSYQDNHMVIANGQSSINYFYLVINP